MNALASKLYKRITNFSLAFVVATSSLTALGAFLAPTAGALPPTGTITVQGNTAAAENTEGWMFNRDVTTSTPFEFNADEAVLGLGSLYVAPISGSAASDKFVAENFLLSEIDDVNTISYDYMIGANGVSSDYDQMYMNVYANFGESSATKFYDCRYTVLASSASTSSFTTLTFDTDSAYLVATRTGGQASPHTCPTVPSAMNLLSADSTIRAFSINVGDTTLGDANIDAYLDNVVVNSVSGITTYDFEPVVPACEAGDNTNFENFSTGTVNGQSGWGSTGPFDQAVVTNDYGIESFGCQTFRLSNAVTSGSFGDQTFSYSTANEAGEADSTNNGKSGGVRQNRYEAQFDIASTQSTVQTGLGVSVAVDRGDGSRMSQLRFNDVAGGIEVLFTDHTFVPVSIATLDRAVPHTIKFIVDYVDGPSNDVVNILIDGVVVHTGTTWEDYYRFNPEAVAEQTPRTSDSLLFRVAGTAAPATAGKGFLFDNVAITTSDSTIIAPEQPTDNNGGSGSGTVTTTTTVVTAITPIITNPASVLGATDNTDSEGESDVEGTTDDKTATAENNTDGVILGLMWYWWILILAGAAGLTWWIIAVYRRRNTEE